MNTYYSGLFGNHYISFQFLGSEYVSSVLQNNFYKSGLKFKT